MQNFSQKLAKRHAQSLYRQRRVLENLTGPEVTLAGKKILQFCSNDYLGLANHPKVIEAFVASAREYGVGAGAAHLVTGHRFPHHALEEELAEYTDRPRVLLFSTGYMANLGVTDVLVGRRDQIYEDRLNHASLLDAARYSEATLFRYPHLDVSTLKNQLVHAPAQGKRLISTDAVFSMDGDLAPLPELAKLAQHHDAWLMVDDAHGFGVLGCGKGTLKQCGLSLEEVPILMATFGKALGTFGAFVAGSEELIEMLIQEARTYIYTTATPPAVAEATRVSLRLLTEEPWRGEHLFKLIRRFRAGTANLDLPSTSFTDSQTPIQPILLGSAERAVAISSLLLEKNILVSAIRPPTVPQGTARLRITLSAAHTEEQVDRLLETLRTVLLHGQS
ncbi:8-amino-7-oxononanoate synthase [Gammaproteobacteria bacterium]